MTLIEGAKALRHYLGVSNERLRAWRRLGLPVRTDEHGRLSASATELDAWVRPAPNKRGRPRSSDEDLIASLGARLHRLQTALHKLAGEVEQLQHLKHMGDEEP